MRRRPRKRAIWAKGGCRLPGRDGGLLASSRILPDILEKLVGAGHSSDEGAAAVDELDQPAVMRSTRRRLKPSTLLAPRALRAGPPFHTVGKQVVVNR